MKNKLLLLAILSLSGCASKYGYDAIDVDKTGVAYERKTNSLVTGTVTQQLSGQAKNEFVYEHGQLRSAMHYGKDGKLNKSYQFNEFGQKNGQFVDVISPQRGHEGSYEHGILDGIYHEWNQRIIPSYDRKFEVVEGVRKDNKAFVASQLGIDQPWADRKIQWNDDTRESEAYLLDTLQLEDEYTGWVANKKREFNFARYIDGVQQELFMYNKQGFLSRYVQHYPDGRTFTCGFVGGVLTSCNTKAKSGLLDGDYIYQSNKNNTKTYHVSTYDQGIAQGLYKEIPLHKGKPLIVDMQSGLKKAKASGLKSALKLDSPWLNKTHVVNPLVVKNKYQVPKGHTGWVHIPFRDTIENQQRYEQGALIENMRYRRGKLVNYTGVLPSGNTVKARFSDGVLKSYEEKNAEGKREGRQLSFLYRKIDGYRETQYVDGRQMGIAKQYFWSDTEQAFKYQPQN